jgi:PAS domain S-box-containing protein
MIEGWGVAFVSPLLFSALLGAGLALFILRNRRTPSSMALLALTLAAALWSFGYAMELLLPSPDAKRLWSKIVYIGVVSAPLAWAIFALRFFGSPSWTNRRLYRILLALIPSLTLVLAWTNEWHGLLWREVFLQPVGPLFTLGVTHGPWFYVHMLFSYGLLLWGSIHLAGGLFSSARLFQWQIVLALIAILVPWVSNLLYISRFNPIPYLDWTPFAFTITGLLVTISLFRFQLIEILPIAQRTVFRGLPDCHMVLDRQDCLVDLNQAAEQTLGRPAKQLAGQPLVQLMPELGPHLAQAGFEGEYRSELTLGEGPDLAYYELRIAPLSGEYPLAVGRLVVCHEITQLKKEQSRLELAVAERTQELQQAVVQLQGELAERALAERRFAQMVESAPDAMVLTDAQGIIQLLNVQAELLFGYTRQELQGQNYEILIPPEFRPALGQVVNQFETDPATHQQSFRLEISAMHKDGQLLPLEISLGRLDTAIGYWVTCNLRDISQRVQQEQAQARLLDKIRQSREQLGTLAVRLEEAQELEQRRIAVELHDRIGQNLTGLNLTLRATQSLLPPEEKAALERLEGSLALVEETTRQVRGLMSELDPPLLREYGLLPALRYAVERVNLLAGIQARVSGEEHPPRLPLHTEMTLFRIFRECITNVVKHAQASQVEISFDSNEKTAVLVVQDNGVGFDPQNLPVQEVQPSWGLVTIQERATAIGGLLQVRSAPGQGTCIQIEIHRGAADDQGIPG